MKFAVESNNGIWVKVQEEIKIPDLRKKILEAQVCISDLDDTDARSPAKEIGIYRNLFRKRMFNPRFFLWALNGLVKYVKKRKNVESECWKEYIELFLRDQNELANVKKSFDKYEIKRLVYQGVKEFYSLLPNTYKVYFSRNIIEIVNIFGTYLGFNELHAEVHDKEMETVLFVEKDLKSRNKKPFTKYLVRGDSIEEEGILEALDFYKRKGRIEYVVSCFRTTREKENPKFSVNVGNTDMGLVSLLN